MTPIEEFYKAVLKVVESLIDQDPPLDSSEGRLLDELSSLLRITRNRYLK